MAFCEPLNELLQHITRETIYTLTPEILDLKHPMDGRPYFVEFVELLNDDGVGVLHYQEAFGIINYFDMSDEVKVDLAYYLHGLLDHARQKGQQPVLKFTRALGRAGWLRHTFPEAKQILLVRPALEQFLSGWELAQRTGNRTFLVIPLFVITRPNTGPLREICDTFGIPRIPLPPGLGECMGVYTRMIDDMSPRTLLAAFLAMFIAAHADSISYADIVIDPSDFVSDQTVHHLEQNIYRISGLRIDFSSYLNVAHSNIFLKYENEFIDVATDVCSVLEGEYKVATDLVSDSLQRKPVMRRLFADND
jgi:hypothetical protein